MTHINTSSTQRARAYTRCYLSELIDRFVAIFLTLFFSLSLWQGCQSDEPNAELLCISETSSERTHETCAPPRYEILRGTANQAQLHTSNQSQELSEDEDDPCADPSTEEEIETGLPDEDDDEFWSHEDVDDDSDDEVTLEDEPPRAEARGTLLAVGDSVLDWNREEGASIPAVVGRYAQLDVINESIGGSQILDSGPGGIPQQYISGAWTWVLIDGGANDVGDGCGCGRCMHQVDRIISADARVGSMVNLVERARADEAQVILLGYYSVQSPDFAGCEEEVAAINARYRQLAERDPSILFVDMSEAFVGPSRDYMDEDGIHPSIHGSQVIGQLIAQRISSAEE